MGAPEQPDFRQRWIVHAQRLLLGRSWPLVATCAVLAAAGAVLASARLQLNANTDSLIGLDRPFMQDYRAFLEQFGDLESIWVAVDAGGDDAAAQAAVDELGTALHRVNSLPSVNWRIDGAEQWGLATRAMADADLEGLTRARGALKVLSPGGATPLAAEVAKSGADRLERLAASGASLTDEDRQRLGAEAVLLLDCLLEPSELSGNGPSLQSPLAEEYLRSPTGRIWFIEIAAHKDFSSLAVIEEPLKQIHTAIAATAVNHPGVEIGLTGKPVLQADELAVSSQDMARGSIVATLVIAVLFMVALRSWREIALAVAAFLAAFCWTYGAATLLVGRLNLLSMVFMLVLVGAGLDYGVHVVARFVEARRTMNHPDAVAESLRRTVLPSWTGALTSASVFFLALATDFGGLRELGLIAGTGLLLCVLAMTTLLPALLLVGARPRNGLNTTNGAPPSPPRPSHLRRKHHWIAGSITAVSAAAALAAAIWEGRFESNLLKLQSEDLSSVEWERRIFADSGSASWFAALVCNDFAEVAQAIEHAAKEPEIGAVGSVMDVVRAPTAQREAWRAEIAECGAQAAAAGSAATGDTPDSAQFVRALQGARDRAASLAGLARLAGGDGAAVLQGLVERLDEALTRTAVDTQTECRAAQERINRASNAAWQIVNGARLSLREALPAATRARLVAPDGALLVTMKPRDDLWELEPLGRFVAAIRRVSPHATGVPITQYESLRDMRGAFTFMSVGSLVLVALIVWLDLRSIAATATCMGCLILALLWTLGTMAALGISLNLANFFGVPMLIGLGVDGAVHILHRWRESHGLGGLGSTPRAVALTLASTAIGFGVLIFAGHRGLQSLGWIMLIGTAATLVAAIGVLPALLAAFPRLAGSHHDGSRSAL